MQTPMISTIVVDDESLARKRINRLLKKVDGIEVVGTCKNGEEAVEQIIKERPSLIFLDIQMPGKDGFEVIQEIEKEYYYPSIIFVTAYDEYALKAFEVHALDYLLKPFEEKKFYESVERALKIIREAETRKMWHRLGNLMQKAEKSAEYLSRIMIKESDRIFFLPVEDIDWIEASGNYVCIHSGGEQHMLRETMTNMEKRLDPNIFYRVHRSTIINLDKVKELEQWFHGDYQIIMENGKKLTLSRNYKELLQKF